MKSTDLRIGNLVLKGELISEIKGIHTETYSINEKRKQHFYINILSNKNRNYESVELDEIEPIELTEEWLLKMGFEKEIEIDELIYKKGEFKMSLDFIMYDIDIKVQFKTVHHLQNTFYTLTGEELTIK